MNLRELLTDAADSRVTEAEPFADALGSVRRRVRRRRAVYRAGSSAVGLVGVAGVATVGTLTWQAAQPDPGPGPSVPVELCGRALPEVSEVPAGPVVGSAALLAAEGTRVRVTASLGNDGADPVTATGPDVVLYLPGTGEVVGVGATDGADSVVLGQGETGSVSAESTIRACDAPDGEAPLTDGDYGLALLGTSTVTGPRQDAGGPERSWLVAGPLVEVRDGEVVPPPVDGPTEEATDGATDPSGRVTPECGAMIPAVPEGGLWASAAADAGPHRSTTAGDTASGGLRLDASVGTLLQQPVTGAVGAVTATVTDLDGVVASWWRLGTDVALDLSGSATQTLPGIAWHPLTVACSTGDAGGGPLPDGDYRLFVTVDVSFEAVDGAYPHPASAVVLTPPLDLTVSGGVATVADMPGDDPLVGARYEFPGTLPPDFPEGRMPPMDGAILGSSGDASQGWVVRGDYSIFDSPADAVDQAVDRLLPVGFVLVSREGADPAADRATLRSDAYEVAVWVSDRGDGSMPGGYHVTPLGSVPATG